MSNDNDMIDGEISRHFVFLTDRLTLGHIFILYERHFETRKRQFDIKKNNQSNINQKIPHNLHKAQ